MNYFVLEEETMSTLEGKDIILSAWLFPRAAVWNATWRSSPSIEEMI